MVLTGHISLIGAISPISSKQRIFRAVFLSTSPEHRAAMRKSREMAAMSGVLTELDVDNLAAHYASQMARAIVFVPVPAK